MKRNEPRNDGHQMKSSNSDDGAMCGGVLDEATSEATAQAPEPGPEPGPNPDPSTFHVSPKGKVYPRFAQRGPNGKYVRGNTAGLVHGLRMKDLAQPEAVPPQFAYMQGDIDKFISGCLSDEGGQEQDIPARRRALLEYRARVHRRILQLDTALEIYGITDAKKHLRVAWISKLVTLIATARSLDATLGLERKERDVTAVSAAEWASRLNSNNNDGTNNEGEDR
jgi:hypothetical protein